MSRRTPPLSPEQLLYAYSNGYFPMADSRQNNRIYWYSPDPRAIIPIETYKPSHSLRPVLNKNLFEIRFNTCFEAVMQACAEVLRPHEEGTWISRELIRHYTVLHRAGFAHSVEAFSGGELAGGLYGMALGSAFFGESMFHFQPNASKVAFHFLMENLRQKGYQLLDTQFMNDNVKRYGAIEISKDEYLQKLETALQTELVFYP
jgi:leucyl/phenylalanyl-tRNA---protein transferase